MLKRMTSGWDETDRLMSPNSMASLILLLEELDGLAGLPLVRVQAIPQQVGQDFEKVRLARAEETRDPDPDHACHDGIVGAVDRFGVEREELAEVLVEFLRDHELVEFLPDGGIV